MGCAFMFSIGDCGCGSEPSCPLTVKVIGCGNASFPLEGVTVTVKDSTGATTVGTGITDETGTCVVDVSGSGTYKVSTDACTPASTSVSVTCPDGASLTLSSSISVNITLIGCSGSEILIDPPAPVSPCVSLTSADTGWTTGGGPFAGCTTTHGSFVTLCVPLPGDYTLTVTDSDCYEPSGPVTITVPSCATYAADPITLDRKTYTATYEVHGCGGVLLPGATVTVSGGGYSQTQTTDANGIATFTGVPSSGMEGGQPGCLYTVTVSKAPRFEAQTITGAIMPCNDGSLGSTQLLPAEGYVCCSCGADPWPDTLFVTDANGTHVVNLVRPPSPPDGALWRGCYIGPTDTIHCGNCALDPDPNGGTYLFVQGNAAISYEVECFPTTGTVRLRQSVSGCNDQEAGLAKPTTGFCHDEGFEGIAGCDGTHGTVIGDSFGPVTADTLNCSTVPVSLAFNLGGAVCYPCGTAIVSE